MREKLELILAGIVVYCIGDGLTSFVYHHLYQTLREMKDNSKKIKMLFSQTSDLRDEIRTVRRSLRAVKK